MDDMAETVLAVSNHLKISRFHLVGHSMGGYVTLAFRETYQHRLISYVLFHSSCVADTDEKRKNRDREIDLVKDGKKHLIINTNIPKTFAEDNLNKFPEEVERVKKIASQTTDEGIIACLSGMKERPDRCSLLLDDIIPLLLILGKKDNIIPFDDAKKLVQSGSNVELAVLSNSGHMGFIEEREEAVNIMINWLMIND
jgi:pimeloyl-ACP methyl ester carboxylesterase